MQSASQGPSGALGLMKSVLVRPADWARAKRSPHRFEGSRRLCRGLIGFVVGSLCLASSRMMCVARTSPTRRFTACIRESRFRSGSWSPIPRSNHPSAEAGSTSHCIQNIVIQMLWIAFRRSHAFAHHCLWSESSSEDGIAGSQIRSKKRSVNRSNFFSSRRMSSSARSKSLESVLPIFEFLPVQRYSVSAKSTAALYSAGRPGVHDG